MVELPRTNVEAAPGARRAAGRVLLAGAALLALAVAGCTNDVKLRQAELQQLASILPGRYDNREQAAAQAEAESAAQSAVQSAARGRPAGEGAETALELNIVPIYAPFLSDNVFYVQENVFGDPRRVLSQRLFVFDVSGDARIVQRVLGFAEPNRWRDGHMNTDLFKGLMGQDVGAAVGACSLVWTLGAEAFSGKAASPGTCIGASRAELTGLGLTIAEPELRFVRRR
jgi:hypothetical protein